MDAMKTRAILPSIKSGVKQPTCEKYVAKQMTETTVATTPTPHVDAALWSDMSPVTKTLLRAHGLKTPERDSPLHAVCEFYVGTPTTSEMIHKTYLV